MVNHTSLEHGAIAASLRERLTNELPDDAGFDAFCSDHFTRAYRQFSNGMQRTAKITILFQYYALDEIKEKLDSKTTTRVPTASRRTLFGSAAPHEITAAGWIYQALTPFRVIAGALSFLVLFLYISDIQESQGLILGKFNKLYRLIKKRFGTKADPAENPYKDSILDIEADATEFDLRPDLMEHNHQGDSLQNAATINKDVGSLTGQKKPQNQREFPFIRTGWDSSSIDRQQSKDTSKNTPLQLDDMGVVTDLLSVDAEPSSELLEKIVCLQHQVPIPPVSNVIGKFLRINTDPRSNIPWSYVVHIDHAIWMMQYEVTRHDYKLLEHPELCEDQSFESQGRTEAASGLDWIDAVRHCNRMSIIWGLEPCYQISGDRVDWQKGIACQGFRLPTEAEWELAAAIGTDQKYAGSDNPDEVAVYLWNQGAYDSVPTIGTKKANLLGIYDMSGNVAEWVWDYYETHSRINHDLHDPLGPASGYERVFRGGSRRDNIDKLQVRNREKSQNGKHDNRMIGLRMAISWFSLNRYK